mmetsp:Transcript_140718/g.245097  ORF Transcript_140718/g.245097 Transcript_140718/m.245097 type:complete len:1529 (-) Transcript_140718:571-5157(-)
MAMQTMHGHENHVLDLLQYGTDDYAAMMGQEDETIGGQWTELEAVDTGLSAVTHALFDPFEELLWTANELGKLTSYYPSFQEVEEGPMWCKYSTFQAHIESVSQMIIEQWGILSLSQNCVRIHTKGGMPTQNFSDDNIHNLLSFSYTDPRKTTLCMGGNIHKIFNYDIHQNVVVTKADTTQGTAVVKTSGRYLCCGGTAGDISLRDPYSLKEQVVIPQVHATLSDFDVKGVLLVTCGFQESMYDKGSWEPDPVVKVFDLRMPLRQLTSLQPHLLPYLVKFHPIFPSSLSVVGQNGTLQFMDVNTYQAEGPVYQVFADHEHTSHITAFDISSSSEALAFGDNTGLVHTWGRKDAPIINNFSDPTEHPINPMPNAAAPVLAADGTPLHVGEEGPYSVVTMPENDEGLLSAWPPPNYMVLAGARPKRVKLAIKKALNFRDFVGHATNPGMNLWDTYEKEADDHPDPWPRNESLGTEPGSVLQALAAPPQEKTPLRPGAATANSPEWNVRRLKNPITPHRAAPRPSPLHTVRLSMATKYRLVEIHENRLSWDDFEFGKYNQTQFRGLENTLPHSYMNALIQALFFLLPDQYCIRSMFLGHTCNQRFCLACELGFLFHMMVQPNGGQGTPAQPANFVRVIRCIAAANGRRLFDMDDAHVAGASTRLMQRIQDFTRFLLPHTSKECTRVEEKKKNDATTKQKPVDKAKTGPEKVLGITTSTVTTCSCGRQTVEEDAPRSTMYLDVCHVDGDGSRHLKLMSHADEYELLGMDPHGNPLPHTPVRGYYPDPLSPSASPLNSHFGAATPVKAMPEAAFELELEDCLNSRPQLKDTGGSVNGWCQNCSRFHAMKTHRQVSQLAASLCLNMNMPQPQSGKQTEDPIWWKAQRGEDADGHLGPDSPSPSFKSPFSYSHISEIGDLRKFTPPAKLHVYKIFESEEDQRNGKCQWRVRSQPDQSLAKRATNKYVYQLSSVVSHIKEPLQTSRKEGHLVTHVRVHDKEQDTWFLFNDFCVSPSSVQEAMCHLPQSGEDTRQVASTLDWQTPLVAFYTHMDYESEETLMPADIVKVSQQNMANPSVEQLLLFDEGCMTLNRQQRNVSFLPLTAAELPKSREMVSLDAEFVCLGWDSKTTKPSAAHPVLGLARVSVCRPSGEAFLDDYIATHDDETVQDYLTRWSGIVPGDLDPAMSVHHVTTLKNTYLKLRSLVDRGVILVGHGLKKDFRIINLHVPKNQIIDTVDLFHKFRARKISLKFLAYHLLDRRIQQETHNSIEDAMIAMRLYKKYVQLVETKQFQKKLEELYEIGNRDNWMLPGDGLPREVKEPGAAGHTAHEKRRLHYQQLMKERQQAQREKKEKEEEEGEAKPGAAAASKPGVKRLNTNAKPFVPPVHQPRPAPVSSLNTNAKPFMPPTSMAPSQVPFSGSGAAAAAPPPREPLFIPPEEPMHNDSYGWGMDTGHRAGPTSRLTTVQQLFQEHQHVQQQQRAAAYGASGMDSQFPQQPIFYGQPPPMGGYPQGPYYDEHGYPYDDGYQGAEGYPPY